MLPNIQRGYLSVKRCHEDNSKGVKRLIEGGEKRFGRDFAGCRRRSACLGSGALGCSAWPPTAEVRLRFLGLTRRAKRLSEKPVSVQDAALSILKAEARSLIIISRITPHELVTRWVRTLKVGGKFTGSHESSSSTAQMRLISIESAASKDRASMRCAS